MHTIRIIRRSILIPALACIVGCSTPVAVKNASTTMKTQTADLTKLYASDLETLRIRLETSGKELDAYRHELAAARTSQSALANRLAGTYCALQMSRAMQQFDLGALNLLSKDFDDAFHTVYLARLQPKLDELKNKCTAAEKAYQADRGNNALLKEYAIATGRLQAVQTQCLEDYRLLFKEFVARITQARQELVNRIATNSPTVAGLDPGAAPDFGSLLKPEAVSQPPAMPDLTAGIAQRRTDLATYATALNGLEAEIDQYLQTDGHRKEIIQAYFRGLLGGAQDTISQLLGGAQPKLDSWLKDSAGIADPKKFTDPLFNGLGQMVTQTLDQAKTSLTDLADKKVVDAENKISQSLNTNK